MTPDEAVDLLTGIESLDEAEPELIRAKEFFEGTSPEYFSSRRVASRLSTQSGQFRINVARKAVTAVTDRLEIASVVVEGNEAATKKLAEIMTDNDMALEGPIVHTKTCEFGDDYVFLAEGDDDGTVAIDRSGALTTRIVYDPESPRKPLFAIKSWWIGPSATKRRRANIYYPETDPGGCRVEKFITQAGGGSASSAAENWQRYTEGGRPPSRGDAVQLSGPVTASVNPSSVIGTTSTEDDDEAIEPWPLPLDRFPVYHFRTDRPYGMPLHFGAYGAQSGISKLVITMMSTVDQHGYPIRWALTDGKAAGDDADDDDFGDFMDEIPTGNPRDKDQGVSKLRSGPGQMWWLDGVDRTGQYDAANMDAFLKPADWLLRMMATATDVPLHFYDPGGDQPSGDSRRQSEGTLTKKVDQLILSLAGTWEKLYADALAMVGFPGMKVRVDFAPTESVDDLEGWQTTSAKIAAGVPVRQALIEAGYRAEQVDDWLKNSDEQDLAHRIAQLAALGAAARDLGTGVTLGVLDQATVAAILSGFAVSSAAPEDADEQPA